MVESWPSLEDQGMDLGRGWRSGSQGPATQSRVPEKPAATKRQLEKRQ